MTEIRVTTSVEIMDNMGKHVASLSRSAATTAAGDNPRFWATYTRGVCQGLEQSLANMLIADYGDKPV
jgi:hypothetical protein